MLTTLLQPPTSIADLIANPPPVTGQTGSQIVDFPYVYVYDGTGLTDGTSPTGLVVPITADADFYLRRVFGVNGVASKIQFRQPTGKRYQSDLEIFPQSYLLNREIKFTADNAIRFDLATVSRSFIACGGNPIYTSYIGWQGAKRMMLNAIPYDTPYAFKRLPVTHTYTLTLDWKYYVTAPVVNVLKRKSLLLQNYDFELHCMRFVRTDGTAIATDPGKFAILLQDGFRNLTSNLPLQAKWVNEAYAGPNSVFPVPPLIYPRNSLLNFDIQSLVCNSDNTTYTYQIEFVGFDRYPLGG